MGDGREVSGMNSLTHKHRAGADSPAEREDNMRFSKYNNPNKRRARKRLSKTDADIIATKNMLDDRRNGIDCPIYFYEWEIYNNALDDFVKMAYEELLYIDGLSEIDIDYIAEQLKAGGENE